MVLHNGPVPPTLGPVVCIDDSADCQRQRSHLARSRYPADGGRYCTSPALRSASIASSPVSSGVVLIDFSAPPL